MIELYTENLDLNIENSTAEPAPDEEDETLTDYILKQKKEAEKQQDLNSGIIYFDENILRPYDAGQRTITTSNRTIFSGSSLTSRSTSRLNNLTSSMTQTAITATTAQSMIAELERRINELEIRREGVFTR